LDCFRVINSFRDPRLGDEARHFVQFVSENFPQVKSFDANLMRQRNENMHAKINEKLIGTFKGTEEERKIKVDDTTGNISTSNKSILTNKIKYLEIPITIYTPVNVTKDKMVVLFHGGGIL
jgi:acetyl esterase/lipase